MNELKIRELKKLVRGEGKERQSLQDIDMSQFRHKRNIRYMRVE